MTDRPILFSGPMVRAILEGRKSQTRRVLKPQPADRIPAAGAEFVDDRWCWLNGFDGSICGTFQVPHDLGDRLWVRETWQALSFGDYQPTKTQPCDLRYAATDPLAEDDIGVRGFPWRPSIFMPRWASRLTLTVTDVRVQRLQEIGEADAKAEGVEPAPCGGCGEATPARRCIGCLHPFCTNGFADLWDSLNQKRGFGWSENPWVAAYTFTVHRSNIDQMDDRY